MRSTRPLLVTGLVTGLVSGLVSGAVLLGCQRNDDRPATTTTTSARVVSNEDAVRRITDARCDRERACNNIGDGKQFANRAVCAKKLSRDAHDTVRSEECPAGVNEANLSQCLADIRKERCDDPVDAVEQLLSCRRAELCPAKEPAKVSGG